MLPSELARIMIVTDEVLNEALFGLYNGFESLMLKFFQSGSIDGSSGFIIGSGEYSRRYPVRWQFDEDSA